MSELPSPQDPNWYKAKNKVGREGIIPANYVQKREGVKAGTKLSLMPCVPLRTSSSRRGRREDTEARFPQKRGRKARRPEERAGTS